MAFGLPETEGQRNSLRSPLFALQGPPQGGASLSDFCARGPPQEERSGRLMQASVWGCSSPMLLLSR